MPNIKKKDLYNFEIWYLSDKSKQEKIVKQLDKVQEIIDLRKKQIEELDNLIKVQFVDMFEDENNWNEVTLNDIAIKITDGEHGTVPRVDNGKLYLMARNITTSNTIDLSEVSYIPEENHRKIYRQQNLYVPQWCNCHKRSCPGTFPGSLNLRTYYRNRRGRRGCFCRTESERYEKFVRH